MRKPLCLAALAILSPASLGLAHAEPFFGKPSTKQATFFATRFGTGAKQGGKQVHYEKRTGEGAIDPATKHAPDVAGPLLGTLLHKDAPKPSPLSAKIESWTTLQYGYNSFAPLGPSYGPPLDAFPRPGIGGGPPTNKPPSPVGPWKLSVTGVQKGDTLVLESQSPSGTVHVPADHKGTMWARRSLASALRFESLHTVAAAPDADFTKTVAETLPVHTPVKISIHSAGTQVAKTSLMVNVTGIKSDSFRENLPSPHGGQLMRERVTDRTSVQQVHALPWVIESNLGVTPAYVDSSGKKRADLVGLAAFPIGAKVTVVALDERGRELTATSRTFDVKKGSGSLKGALPVVEVGGGYKLSVWYPEQKGAAGVRVHNVFHLPDPESADVKAKGLGYYAVKLTPVHSTSKESMPKNVEIVRGWESVSFTDLDRETPIERHYVPGVKW